MSSNHKTTTANPYNLAFIRDGYQLVVANSDTICLIRDGNVHMAFKESPNREHGCIYSLYNVSPKYPVPVNDYCSEMATANIEKLGVILGLGIDGAYTHKCYADDVRKRILELNDDYHYSLLLEMFAQCVSAPRWMDVFGSLPHYLANKHELANALLFGSLRKKKKVLDQVLGPKTYDTFNIKKRGRRYIDALAGRLLSLYHVD